LAPASLIKHYLLRARAAATGSYSSD